MYSVSEFVDDNGNVKVDLYIALSLMRWMV